MASAHSGRDLTRFRAPAMAPARRAVGSGCLERARHRRSLPRRQYRIAVDRGSRPGPPRSLRREIHARDLYRDNGPQHSQSENHTSHDLSCLVLATSHSHAHVSRANTTARRESPQPMPRGSSMPRTESARVHMQGAGRVRRCSLFAPRAPLIHPMTSASSTHAVSRVLRPCRCHSCLPGIALVSPSDLPGLPLPFPRRCCFVQSRPWFWPWLWSWPWLWACT